MLNYLEDITIFSQVEDIDKEKEIFIKIGECQD